MSGITRASAGGFRRGQFHAAAYRDLPHRRLGDVQSFLSLTGQETQTYTLTLRPQAPGTYTLQGWTTQPSTGRGFGASVTVTVTS